MKLIEQKEMLWDLCICIDFIQAFMSKTYKIINNERLYFDAIKKIWAKFENKEIRIYALTLAFVESVRINGLASPLQVLKVRKFFQKIHFNMIAIEQNIAEGANAIRSLTQISLDQYDAIHLSSARELNIPILITRDNKKPRPFLLRDAKYKTKKGKQIRILTPENYIKTIENEKKAKFK